MPLSSVEILDVICARKRLPFHPKYFQIKAEIGVAQLQQISDFLLENNFGEIHVFEHHPPFNEESLPMKRKKLD